MIKRPMLAETADLAKLQFPKLGSAKLDGIRAVAIDGKAMSRAMKPLPNKFIQSWFSDHAELLQGMDGELVVGAPTDANVYTKTTSAVMSEDGEPDFTYYVFDYIRHGLDLPYVERVAALPVRGELGARVTYLEHEPIADLDALNAFEARMLEIGYEGVILRDPQGPYKQNRSTIKEGWLLKVKRHADAEAVVVGFEEEMFNGNEAMVDERGFTKRSTHQGNKTGKNRLGVLIVQGINGAFENITFEVGSGFTAAQREALWVARDQLMGRLITYKYFPIGILVKPRHPVFKGFRDPIDL